MRFLFIIFTFWAVLIASGCFNMIIQVFGAKFSCEVEKIYFFTTEFCLHDFSLCVILKLEYRKFSITLGG